jgi:hypothetical protein
VTQVSAELCRGMKYHMTIPREMPLVIMDASSHAAGQARHRFGPPWSSPHQWRGVAMFC